MFSSVAEALRGGEELLHAFVHIITGPYPVTSISKVHPYKGSRREILLNPGASPDLPFILPDNKLLERQVLLLDRECGRSSRESEDWEPAGEVFSRIPGHHRNNFIERVLGQTKPYM